VSKWLAVVAAATAIGCSASFPAPTAPVALASVTIRYPANGANLAANSESAQFQAYAVDGDGLFTNVTSRAAWATSNPAVLVPLTASTLTGTFFPAAAGTADVRATYQGVVGTLTVTVRGDQQPYLRILGGPPRPSVFVFSGGLTQDVSNVVSWSSSNPAVGEMRPTTGLFIGIPGNVELRATYNGLSGSLWLGVPPRTR